MENKKNHTSEYIFFKDFLVEPSNQLAYSIAHKLSNSAMLEFNPIMFYGEEGSGKSLLLSLIKKEIQTNFSDHKVIFTTGENFQKGYVQSLRKGNYQNFRQYHRSCQYFILDDIHLLENKQKTQQELMFTIDVLQDRAFKVIFSSKYPIQEISLQPALKSRLVHGLNIKLHPLSNQSIIDYCQRRARFHQVNMEKEVPLIMWECFGISFGHFKKVVDKIFQLFKMQKKAITLKAIKEIKKQYLEQNQIPLTFDKILIFVAKHYNLDNINLLKETGGARTLTNPRYIAMGLSKELLSMKVSELQKHFGMRSESSIRYALSKIVKNSQLQIIYQNIHDKLLGREE